MIFEEILKDMRIVRGESKLTEALDLAIRKNLTLYDSYYIYTARSMKIKLATEDKSLLKFPETLNVDAMLAELYSRCSRTLC